MCPVLCASNGPSIVFHPDDVSSPFPFCVGYVLDCACHSGYLPKDGDTGFVFQPDNLAFSFPCLVGLFQVSSLMLL